MNRCNGRNQRGSRTVYMGVLKRVCSLGGQTLVDVIIGGAVSKWHPQAPARLGNLHLGYSGRAGRLRRQGWQVAVAGLADYGGRAGRLRHVVVVVAGLAGRQVWLRSLLCRAGATCTACMFRCNCTQACTHVCAHVARMHACMRACTCLYACMYMLVCARKCFLCMHACSAVEGQQDNRMLGP